MRAWYCAQTAPRQELLAKEQLERQGMVVFLPSYLVRHKSRHIVAKCLFPSYLFVSPDNPHDWPVVKNTIGITNVMLYQPERAKPGDQLPYKMPVPMAESVESLRLQALSFDEIRRDGGQRQITASPRQCITAGCYVKILKGPLVDLNVQKPIVEWSEGERATLLLALFGRTMRVEFFHKDLEVVK